MTPDECGKKQAVIQAISDEILGEIGKPCFLDSWYIDRTTPSIAVAHINTMVSVCIDLHKKASKSQICEHLVDSLKKMLDLWWETLQKLQQIQERGGST